MASIPSKSLYMAAFSAATPVFVVGWLFFAIPWALTGGSLLRAYFVMAMALVALFASAIIVHRLLLTSRGFLRSALAALATVIVVWVWQRTAFHAVIPNGFLEYGYFLRGEEGARARLLFLELPYISGSVILLVLLALAIASSWRFGARWLCFLPPLWWAALFVLFSLPYLAWSVQGDASVFI